MMFYDQGGCKDFLFQYRINNGWYELTQIAVEMKHSIPGIHSLWRYPQLMNSEVWGTDKNNIYLVGNYGVIMRYGQ